MSKFEQFLASLPMLHTWDSGLTWNTGGFSRLHLETLHDFLGKKMPRDPAFLETGAGNSTIALLFLEPRRLVSIAPDSALFDRIRAYCLLNDISTAVHERIVDGSEWALPKLALQMRENVAEFDFALIDGCHNWPMVFVDFFYVNYMLKEGGYLMIDDVQLHSVKELARLLSEESNFELVLDLGKSLVFRRSSASRTLGEWIDLSYLVRKSNEYERLRNPFSL
jgi:hypothetical protein